MKIEQRNLEALSKSKNDLQKEVDDEIDIVREDLKMIYELITKV